MSDRDRLIELLQEGENNYFETGANATTTKQSYIADYLLANGVIVPPCKVGDIVYAKYSGTNETEYYVVDKVAHIGSNYFEFEAHLENEDGYTVDIIEFVATEIGKTVFLTKEEAEQALAERSGGNA